MRRARARGEVGGRERDAENARPLKDVFENEGRI